MQARFLGLCCRWAVLYEAHPVAKKVTCVLSLPLRCLTKTEISDGGGELNTEFKPHSGVFLEPVSRKNENDQAEMTGESIPL